MDEQTNIGISVQVDDDSILRNVVFRIEDFVGSGQLSAVYRGVAQIITESHETAQHDVVVKVPHSRDKFREAELEFNTLTAMASAVPHDISLPIPQVWRGMVDDALLVTDIIRSDEAERPVIVMPYYDNEQLLTHKVHDLMNRGELIATEQLAVEAAIAFTYAMSAVHTTNQTCTDRKIKDFYLTEQGIVIIDWKRAAQ